MHGPLSPVVHDPAWSDAWSQLAAALLIGRSPRTVAAADRDRATDRLSAAIGQEGAIQHVIYVQFDNTHFLRDNPNVPSDVEQMPNLLNFIKDNGTLLTNDHTVLISHTGGGILSSLTGLYPDRHGQAVSNSYNYFRPNGTSGFSSTFKYWTDKTDGGNPATVPPTVATDTNYNMVNARLRELGGSGSVRNAPAPWVPFTRAGCDVGNVSVANTVLENNSAVVFGAGPTASTAATVIGATSINVSNRSVLRSGWRSASTPAPNLETASIASIAPLGTGNAGTSPSSRHSRRPTRRT